MSKTPITFLTLPRELRQQSTFEYSRLEAPLPLQPIAPQRGDRDRFWKSLQDCRQQEIKIREWKDNLQEVHKDMLEDMVFVWQKNYRTLIKLRAQACDAFYLGWRKGTC
jgi:hypothetical protein